MIEAHDVLRPADEGQQVAAIDLGTRQDRNIGDGLRSLAKRRPSPPQSALGRLCPVYG